jgi:hypothetical protein
LTRSRVLVSFTIVASALALFSLRVSRNMPDFEVYWNGAGRAVAAEPLYRAEDQHYQFKYLPAFAVLTIPLSFMPLPVAKGVWFASSVALLVLLIAMSSKLLPDRRKPTMLLAVIVIVVLGKFFARELLLGQVNLLFAVIATSAFLAMKAHRDVLAGALIALTIAIKPYGIILVPWLVARRKIASVLAACLAVAVVFLLPAVLYGIEGNTGLHQAWWKTVNETTAPNLLNPDNVSLAGMYAKWLGPGRLAASLALVTALTLLGAAVVVFLRRRGLAFPEGLEGSLLLILIPLLSPQGWDYVLLVATPAIMYLANYEDRLPAVPRLAAILAALTMGLSLFDVMGRTAYAAFMAMAIISVCALVLVSALCALRLKKIA